MRRKIAGILAAVLLLGAVNSGTETVFAAESFQMAKAGQEEKQQGTADDRNEIVAVESNEAVETQRETEIQGKTGAQITKTLAAAQEGTDTQKGTEVQTEAGTQKAAETQKETQTQSVTETQKETETQNETETQKETETETQKETETEVPPTGPVYVTVSAAKIASKGTKKAIQAALDEAHKNATKESPYIIKVEPGSYEIPGENVIRMFSYTTLDLSDVIITRKTARNIIRIGETRDENETAGETGYFYKDIKVIGGVLDGNKIVNCTVVKVGHTENFTMENVTLKNAADGHLMEAAGVDGLTLKNCVFSDQTLSSTSLGRYEAVQLDILHSAHMNGYRSEALANKNILVEGCTFKNVPRGLGSHSAIMNFPIDGITVKGCTFESNTDAAIRSLNWTNCTITGNVIRDCPRGILLYSVYDGGTGMYLPSTVAAEGVLSASVEDIFTEGSRNKKYIVTDNTIDIQSQIDKKADYERAALTIGGDSITLTKKQSDGSGGLPKANSYIQDVTVSGNKITAPSAYGIRMMDNYTAVASGNTINGSTVSGASGTYYGLAVTEGSTGISVQNNTINNVSSNGIYVLYSASTLVKNNTVKKAGAYGISVYASTVESVVQNKVENCTKYGIYFSGKSTVEQFKNNTMSGNGGGGYEIADGCKVTKNSGNIFCSAPALSGVTCGSKGLVVSWKAIAGADKYRVYRVASGKYTKMGNTAKTSYTDKKVESGKKYSYAIRVIKCGKVSSAYTEKPLSAKFLAAPVISSVKKSGSKAMTVKWKKASKGSGYQIAYSTNSKFKNAKTTNVSGKKKVSKKIKKLTKKKTYYVRIRVYKGSGSSRIYSGWSAVKKVKL